MRDIRKISTANLQKIRVNESNGDVISALSSGKKRHSAIFSKTEIAFDVEMAQDKWEMSL
jgi:hypothetical protein